MKTPLNGSLGKLLLGILGILCGLSALMAGQAGYKYGYANGANVRLGGLIFVFFGCWFIFEYFRSRKSQ